MALSYLNYDAVLNPPVSSKIGKKIHVQRNKADKQLTYYDIMTFRLLLRCENVAV